VLASDRLEAFRRDGAVCVRGAFSPEEVALVERGIERNLAEPSRRAIVASRPDDPGRFVEDFCNWRSIPEYEEFVKSSAAAALAGELMASERVRLFTTTCSSRSPARRSARRGTRTSPTTTSRAPRP
jgi:hypothetical protein